MVPVVRGANCPRTDCTSIGELKNMVINYHLQSYVMDRSMVFFF